MAELERVLYAQMLILFAPHASHSAAHVPLLLGTLKSRQPALRKAAADTLRHLAGPPKVLALSERSKIPACRLAPTQTA